MKAAVILQPGRMPEYVIDFPEPVANHGNQVVISMKAAAVKNFDKSRASGEHYSTRGQTFRATVPGGDGVGVLPDGERVYAVGMHGMIAEKALVEKSLMVPVPAELDDATAAALPNAVMGAALAMKFRAQLEPGESVLINGATGVTGRVAVQLAKYYGAANIVATGRNESSLRELRGLGAGVVVDLKQDADALIKQIKQLHHQHPFDVVVDFLWGSSAEMILSALQGNGRFTHRTRYVSVGSMLGDTITLSSAILRGTDLHVNGSGLGSWSEQEVQQLLKVILPETFQLAANGRLTIKTMEINLSQIGEAWDMEIVPGTRLVVVMP